jgi:hypothetical protein
MLDGGNDGACSEVVRRSKKRTKLPEIFSRGYSLIWYIQSAKVICVSSISKLECTMFVVRYVLCNITCKS